jgi:hypothetical protein
LPLLADVLAPPLLLGLRDQRDHDAVASGVNPCLAVLGPAVWGLKGRGNRVGLLCGQNAASFRQNHLAQLLATHFDQRRSQQLLSSPIEARAVVVQAARQFPHPGTDRLQLRINELIRCCQAAVGLRPMNLQAAVLNDLARTPCKARRILGPVIALHQAVSLAGITNEAMKRCSRGQKPEGKQTDQEPGLLIIV